MDRLEALEKEVKNLKTALDNHISEYERYNKYEANAQEEEITQKLFDHLDNNRILRSVNNHTNFRISKKLIDCEGNFITDLDGFIIFKDNTKTLNFQFQPELIIIEAKHHVTRNKVLEKQNQISRIRYILDTMDDTILEKKCSKRYLKMVASLKKAGLNKDTFIQVYIGGLWWEEDAINECNIQHFNRIILSGNRYKIIDKYSQFTMIGGSNYKYVSLINDDLIPWKNR